LIRFADYGVPYVTFYFPAYDEAARRGDWQAASAIMAESLRVVPPAVAEMSSGRGPLDAQESQLAGWYARVYERYATALRNTDVPNAAQAAEEKAAALARAAPAE